MLDTHDANAPGLGKGQRRANPKAETGFRNAIPVNPQMPCRHQLGGQPAGFKEPRVPEPFVYSLRGGFGQEFLSFSPISA